LAAVGDRGELDPGKLLEARDVSFPGVLAGAHEAHAEGLVCHGADGTTGVSGPPARSSTSRPWSHCATHGGRRVPCRSVLGRLRSVSSRAALAEPYPRFPRASSSLPCAATCSWWRCHWCRRSI